MVVVVNSQNLDQEINKSELPVIVDVFATWCGPCQQMVPVFEELEKELADKYKFVKINIDEERDLAIQYNVSSIPTFLFIKDGNVVGRETGFMNKEIFKEKAEGFLS